MKYKKYFIILIIYILFIGKFNFLYAREKNANLTEINIDEDLQKFLNSQPTILTLDKNNSMEDSLVTQLTSDDNLNQANDKNETLNPNSEETALPIIEPLASINTPSLEIIDESSLKEKLSLSLKKETALSNEGFSLPSNVSLATVDNNSVIQENINPTVNNNDLDKNDPDVNITETTNLPIKTQSIPLLTSEINFENNPVASNSSVNPEIDLSIISDTILTPEVPSLSVSPEIPNTSSEILTSTSSEIPILPETILSLEAPLVPVIPIVPISPLEEVKINLEELQTEETIVPLKEINTTETLPIIEPQITVTAVLPIEIKDYETEQLKTNLLEALPEFTQEEPILKEIVKEKLEVAPDKITSEDKIISTLPSISENKLEIINNIPKEIIPKTLEEKLTTPKKSIPKVIIRANKSEVSPIYSEVRKMRDDEYERLIYEYNKRSDKLNNYKIVSRLPDYLAKKQDSQNKHLTKVYYQEDYVNSLFAAIDAQNLKVMDQILKILKNDYVQNDQGDNTLIYAIRYKKNKAMNYLLKRGFDTKLCNKYGEDAFAVALKVDNYEALAILKNF